MCDFDIATFREKATPTNTTTTKKSDSDKGESAFALYMKKRKMLKLDDSDSDSDDDGKEKVDPMKKRKGQENSKDDTTKPTPSSETIADNSSPLDIEQVTFKQDLAIQVDSEKTTYKQQQPPVQNANQSPIILTDDDPPVVKRNDTTHIVGGIDLTTESPKRRTKPRPIQTVSLDIEDLDPELANLFTQETDPSSAGDKSKTEVVPQKVQIKVSYVSLMETVDANIQNIIDALSKPVKIIMLNNGRFDTLMEQYCKKKRLAMQDMVLVYENIPVVLRATPSSLSMSTTSTNKMEVYKRSDFDKKMELEKEIKAARLSQYNDSTSGDGDGQDDSDDGYNHSSDEKQQQPEEDYLHIKLRGKDNKDVLLRVKPTTQIESIVKQYIRLMELDMALLGKIQLSFEGETLKSTMTIADTDLEDEDMVSVIIHS